MEMRYFEEIRLSLFPKPVVVVTSRGHDGRTGATTIGWNGVLSSRPLIVGVSFLPDSFTRACILESREFVVNVPSHEMWREVNYLGSVSGPWELKLAGMEKALSATLSLSDSKTVKAPGIKECYLSLECRLLRVVQCGLYDSMMGMVVGMRCHADVYLDDHPRGSIDHTRVFPLIGVADEYWGRGVQLGKSTENKNHPHGDRD